MKGFTCLRASRPRQTLLLGPLLVLAGVLAGCTAIGYAIGAKIDSSRRKLVAIDGWDLERIETGSSVRVLFRDAREASGVFGGLEASGQEYRVRYDRWREARTEVAAVPMIGDPITVESVAGKTWSGAFMGFEYTSLSIKGDGESNSEVPYRRIARVSTAEGAAWNGTQLADLASRGGIPLRSCMLLNKVPIPLDQVGRVEVWREGNIGKIVGALVGVAVDAVLIAAVVYAPAPAPPPPTYTSCPYVYSFDGERYVHEGDAFPGAIFRASQRSDRLVLEHLAESGGAYRLRLTNELQEVQHVDEVQLVVVDGPEGAVVVPTPGGRLRPLSNPVAPAKASDLAGHSVLTREAGVEAWISSPFAGDPNRPAETRDGILLEFPRPAMARSVTLVVRAQPTPWASHLLRQVLTLQGRNLPAWYARMDHDAVARAEFLGALRREGHLILRVWKGASWQEVGAVTAHEAVELPIEDLSGDRLRLRLDSTPGLWTVDGAEVDYGPASPLDVTELRPAVARMRDRDVRDRLGATDARRLVMERGDSVDLTFEAPPPRAGRHRTFVLKAAGYYTILVPTGGEPRPALFARLVNQPGALGEYGRDLLRSDLEASMARFDRGLAHATGD